jgi:hypothetical protein
MGAVTTAKWNHKEEQLLLRFKPGDKAKPYSGAHRAKLLENCSDFFLVLGRAHPQDTTERFLPENI